jgi:hypothetical protein
LVLRLVTTDVIDSSF